MKHTGICKVEKVIKVLVERPVFALLRRPVEINEPMSIGFTMTSSYRATARREAPRAWRSNAILAQQEDLVGSRNRSTYMQSHP